MEQTAILICTVGGSHQPIVKAIRELNPGSIVFVCSEDNPATHAKGSYIQIEGKGNCIKANRDDAAPGLPNIPAQADFSGQYEILHVPADELNICFERINHKTETLLKDSPSASLIADYTGGTKTMTAALAMAAIEHEGIQLHLVTGRRSDLVRVRDGSESGLWASVEGIRLKKRISECLHFWQHYAYAQASVGLNHIPLPEQAALRGVLLQARDLSSAFAAWHRFDHSHAHELLHEYQAALGKHGAYISIVSRLANPQASNHEPAMIYDLWLNAERRGKQGNHDEAVAICYRMWEWTAQWLLRSCCDIDTSNIRPDQLPDSIKLTCNADGKQQLGLFAAWELLQTLRPDSPAGIFFSKQKKQFLDIVKVRNYSILAHGFDPVSMHNWGKIHGWIERSFLPMLTQELSRSGFKYLPAQLPEQFPLI